VAPSTNNFADLQVFGIVAALALARVADLHEEFAALRKFQDHVVMVALGSGPRLLPPIQTLPL